MMEYCKYTLTRLTGSQVVIFRNPEEPATAYPRTCVVEFEDRNCLLVLADAVIVS